MSNEESSLLKCSPGLSDVLYIKKMIRCRAKEIQTLQNSISQQTGTKLVFQRLPRHMRRRTMSHNVKRLPRQLREAHSRQMAKAAMHSQPLLRTTRQHRRRHSHLMLEYTRRQRHQRWLETHLWHAKRFHMVTRWGYRLADRPCDKSFRACYRAAANHCLIQDISYFGCLQLQGDEATLLEKLKELTSPAVGLTVSAKAYIRGAREGNTVFYHRNTYPFKAIGQVSFMWKPNQDYVSRTLWLWIHPAYYSELKECLLDLFDVQLNNPNSENTIKITEIQNLNRFRLTGPLANSVLQRALKLTSENNMTDWFQQFLVKNKQIFDQQCQYFQSLQNISSTSELSANIICNIIVTDPRHNLPEKRTKALPQLGETEEDITINDAIKVGAIWNEEIRNEVGKNVANTSQIFRERAQKLVTDDSDCVDSLAALPIMLVQRPGTSQRLGYGSGWDVICPGGWGRSLWVSVVMRGARAAGLRDFDAMDFEQGLPSLLQPDTISGQLEQKRSSDICQNKFFALPPNKRINFIKYGIASPFTFPWKTIIQEWSEHPEANQEFFVLRDRKMLIALQDLLTNNRTKSQKLDLHFHQSCIVPVKLTLLNKGRVKKYSIICVPKESDLKIDPIEPLHEDKHQKLRKKVRDDHKKLLRRLRKKRVLGKEGELDQEHAQRMRQLWLCVNGDTIRESCSRMVAGFVCSNGNWSLSSGQARALGYVALTALPTLTLTHANTVLVRDTHTTHYRKAHIQICCN